MSTCLLTASLSILVGTSPQYAVDQTNQERPERYRLVAAAFGQTGCPLHSVPKGVDCGDLLTGKLVCALILVQVLWMFLLYTNNLCNEMLL